MHSLARDYGTKKIKPLNQQYVYLTLDHKKIITEFKTPKHTDNQINIETIDSPTIKEILFYFKEFE